MPESAVFLIPYLISGLGIGAVYALSGVGLVVLYRASGVLNFAFGALGAISAYCAWSLLEMDYPQIVVWPLAVLASTLLSLLYGAVLAPRLAHRDRTTRSIATLGFALVVLGFTEWYWGEAARRLSLPTDVESIDFGDIRLTYTRILSLVLAVLMMLAIGILLRKTRLGLYMRALANNRQLSAVLGISVIRVDTAAWLISGAFAGVCGLLLANIVRLQATTLTFMVIPAFAAAIVGRLSSLPITVAAGVVIGIAEALAITIPGFAIYRSVTPFVLALLAMMVFTAIYPASVES
ncbi:branched-chain amino acid ABC transporter permease [Iodobacter sp. CM08]|uniref:branched-chain amino acid ABC transporter permease n=1 Tax=Iodobacter sp. CM08 TaxID=3085902 RepID=UPI0029823114|nr:branched-chain amino acid ABC transporter permease [Iodobacter sp. CM08]MDW5416649.1 branched-chain amino acid ABC transporter permease [Iodobacter sp. CM08]